MSCQTSHHITLPENLPVNIKIHLNPAAKHIEHTNNYVEKQRHFDVSNHVEGKYASPSSTGQHPLLHMQTGQRLKAADELAGSPAP
jgi:hypothetical protein